MIWREMFRQLPESQVESDWQENATPRITRGAVKYVLSAAMSRFDERPSRKDFEAALLDVTKHEEERFPMPGITVYEAFEALDRTEGNLAELTEGLFRGNRSEEADPGADESTDVGD